MSQQYAITRDQAREIAEKMIYEYLTADHGQKLVSSFDNPLQACIQGQTTYCTSGEVFSVDCPGFLGEGWNCDHLSEEEIVEDEISALSEKIWNSIIETNYPQINKIHIFKGVSNVTKKTKLLIT